MGWGALRNVIRPLTRSVLTRNTICSPAKLAGGGGYITSTIEFRSMFDSIRQPSLSLMSQWQGLHSLTDTRLPKRRPGFENRRKRSSLKPKGPYAWVQYTPGESIIENKPNEGSVKRRNEKKRIALRKAFIKSEAKKRKVQMQEAKKKKLVKRVERKMAAVARDRAWAQRLAELQQLEAEKAATT
ncbi:hypothetical protein FRX31_012053 [Thalictrum thalictroides]|uniref:Uncharacterized protein n=1 Tax=Thalictrum thalictroides TaxID=46969 RepID=A0A7J6WQI3_THATH|nr:hypothetical protein FRX31_012053 [Thalictrum thalictroides]